MEIQEVAAPSIQQHNAQYPREIEAVREIDRLLRLEMFPYERIWVDVRFDYAMSDHSSSKLTLMSINSELHGIAELKLQGLYLWQDFETFMNEVIPHELAHILLDLRSAQEGKDAEKGHGEEWLDMVLTLNPDAEPAAKVKGEFDERPIKLQKGGIACECDCDDLSAFVVMANTTSTAIKLKDEDLICTQCHSSYRRITAQDWPSEITKSLQFYEGVLADKAHNPPLSR